MHIPAGRVLIPLGLTPWPWTHPGKKGKHFPGFPSPVHSASLSSAPHYSTWKLGRMEQLLPQQPQAQMPPQPLQPLPLSASPESWLLSSFQLLECGCLLLGSAHPLGSTVRLRDPAQEADRQGSEPQSCHGERAAEREGMKWSLCCLLAHCCQQPWTFLLLSLSLPTLTLLPGHSALSGTALSPCHPSPAHRQENPKGTMIIFSLYLIFSSSLLFLNLVWEKRRWGPPGGAITSPAGWLTRVRKAGPIHPTGERPLSDSLPPQQVPSILTWFL